MAVGERRERRHGRRGAAILLAVVAAWVSPGAAEIDPRLGRNLEVILDTSGSMLRDDKIAIAKAALLDFFGSVPADVPVGLIVFDGRAPKRLLPLGPLDRARIAQIVGGLEADSQTPIKASLELAEKSLLACRAAQAGYGVHAIVLVTDGEETVDPALLPAAVGRILAEGIEIHVIGLDLPGGHTLKETVTSYRSARNREELKAALRGTLAEAATYREAVGDRPAPAQPAPEAPAPGGGAGTFPRPVAGGAVILVGCALALLLFRWAKRPRR